MPAIAIDDHVIAAVAVHEAVAFLLDNLPPQLTLAMTTQADRPLPIFGTGVVAPDLAEGTAWGINLAVAEWATRHPARRRPAVPARHQQPGALA